MEPYPHTSFVSSDEPEAPAALKNEIVPALVKERKLRIIAALERLLLTFTPGERLLLYGLSVVLGLTALALVADVNAAVSVPVPARGGMLTEGEVGPARFINPLLALSQPDQDLTALVYSGLMRELPDGSFVPDLAQSYSISSDGTTYTFHLRPSATFQDGTKVTSDDVVYTIHQAQNPNINSIHRADWVGVTVSNPDPETVVITLPHPYAPFIADTTLGILPKHLWQSVSDEEFPFSTLNTHPIGSGPYKVQNVTLDSTGAAARYDLSAFNKFTLGEPYLSDISFVFFPSENDLLSALNAGKVDAASGVDASQLRSITRPSLSAAIMPLPRDFGVFFNQNQSKVLADAAVRKALAAAVDQQEVVDVALGGLGTTLDGPIPQSLQGDTLESALPQPLTEAQAMTASTTLVLSVSDAQNARQILQQDGWTYDQKNNAWTKGSQTLSFTLATADQPQLVATGNALVAMWKAVGIQASLQVYPLTELNTNIIRPRSYDALLFGEAVGPELDLYAFWHSSQRNDPGLNLAMYANLKVDNDLSQARATTDTNQRNALNTEAAAQIQKDMPAEFLYTPDFVYVVPNDLSGVKLGSMTQPSDRFDNVYQWYRQTRSVWRIFAASSTH